MQKQEFEERIERTVTDEQYKVIEAVYMDKLFDELFIHPFIEGGHSNEEKRDRAEN